jgi:hypothetical protein
MMGIVDTYTILLLLALAVQAHSAGGHRAKSSQHLRAAAPYLNHHDSGKGRNSVVTSSVDEESLVEDAQTTQWETQNPEENRRMMEGRELFAVQIDVYFHV